jgi:hypothetical protein
MADMDVRARDVVAASPGWWLGVSGRWEYRVQRFGYWHVTARRVTDGTSFELLGSFVGLTMRAVARRIRVMERREGRMP